MDVLLFANVSFGKRLCVLCKILLLCGDVEQNPGLVVNFNSGRMIQSSRNVNSESLLRDRLPEVGLELLDCVGDGDCFFRNVSHQLLFGSPSYHLAVRFAGVEYEIILNDSLSLSKVSLGQII